MKLVNKIVSFYRIVLPYGIRKRLKPILLRMGTVMLRFSGPLRIRHNEYIICMNPQDRWGLELYLTHYLTGHFNHEPFEMAVFRELLRANSGCVVIDIGANYGFYTLEACLARDRTQVKVVMAIEAEKKTFEFLMKSLVENGFEKQVIAVNAAAVDEHDSIRHFWTHKTLRFGSILAWSRVVEPGHHYYSPTYEVQGVTVDGLLLEAGIETDNMFIVKMDIEGGEVFAFEGIKRTLQASRGYMMLFEFNPRALEECNCDPHSFVKELVALKPDLILEILEANKTLRPVSGVEGLEEVLERCLASPDVYARFTNILICKDMSLGKAKSIGKC